MNSSDILNQLYSLHGHAFNQRATEVTLEYLNQHLTCDRFEQVDAFFEEADIKRLDSVVLLAVLGFTQPAKKHLPQRSGFLERTEKELIDRLGEARTLKILESRR